MTDILKYKGDPDYDGRYVNLWRRIDPYVPQYEWDISTAIYNPNPLPLYLSGYGSIALNSIFSPDGLTWYVLFYGKLAAYKLNVPFDPQSRYSDYLAANIGAVSVNTQGVCWAKSGTKLLVGDFILDDIYQLDLATPYDPTTFSYSGVKFNVAAYVAGYRGVEVDDTAETLFVSSSGGANLPMAALFDISDTGDLSGAISFKEGITYTDIDSALPSAVSEVVLDPSGLMAFLVSPTAVFQVHLKTRGTFVGATYQNQNLPSVKGGVDINNFFSVVFNPNGLGFTVINSSATAYTGTMTLKQIA